MPNGKQITNNNLYDFIDKVRLELKSDNVASYNNVMTEVRGLRSDFTDLERGRLTRAEGNISNLGLDLQKAINQFNEGLSKTNKNEAVLSSKVLIIWAIGGSIFIVISELIVNRLFK